jgi:hypothetical protein
MMRHEECDPYMAWIATAWDAAQRARQDATRHTTHGTALLCAARSAWRPPRSWSRESVESNGVADAVKLAVCSCI